MCAREALALIEFAELVSQMERAWWQNNQDLPPMKPPATELDAEGLIYRWSLLTLKT